MSIDTTTPSVAETVRAAAPAFVRTGAKQLFIGGRHVPAASGQVLESVDPTTEEPLPAIARGGAADIDAAVLAARAVFDGPTWSRTDPDLRSRVLFQIAAVIDAHRDELATIESMNMGMPVRMTRFMIADVARIFRHYAGWPTKVHGLTAATPDERFAYTRREPLGVVGAIWGWNGPLPQLALKLAPALATGNTAVLKPPAWASLSTLRLVELLAGTDLPTGVVNVVTGTGTEAGEELVRHPGVAKIAFTGSTEVGKRVHSVAGADLKRLTLELGGKSPLVVCADADLDAAAHGAAAGFLLGSGQACVATTRILVQEEVREEFAGLLTRAMAEFTVGDPLDPATTMGPLATRAHFDRVLSWFDIAAAEGARCRVGGTRHGARGFFVAPTLLDAVTPDMRVVREEIFGPVGALLGFTDLDDALAQANSTEYGLAASVWTNDLSTAHRLAAGIDAGTVWVNTNGEMTTGPMPFAGFKQSGSGGEGGPEVIDAFTRHKSVVVAV